MKNKLNRIALLTFTTLSAVAINAEVNVNEACKSVPDYFALMGALKSAVSSEGSGLDNHMWATLVNRDGIVCAVVYSGPDRYAQWLGSRVISAQKAYTANAFSLDKRSSKGGSGQKDGLALSTANLFAPTQTGASLYGLQFSNPVNTETAYRGPVANFGTASDPMIGTIVGGINVFGGGLALFNGNREIVGALGVSGDTSCADHFIAWRVRNVLGLDNLRGVKGVSPDAERPDNIILDIAKSTDSGLEKSASGFGHPSCPNTGDPSSLPKVR